MARREGEEISAGSMADIAFLLLIFFIVTTTMELEAGIPQTLPMKVDAPIDYIPPEVKKRDVFSISVMSCCSSFGDECSVQLLILCTESFLLVFLAVPNSAEVTVDCRLICG